MIMIKRQVSSAATELGISQPAMSRSLTKLREYFDDPLFVRAQYSMEPTSAALALSPTIDKMLEIYNSELNSTPSFNPQNSNRVFNIVASDVGHVILLSKLLSEVVPLAPGIRFNAVPLGQETITSKLESGEADLAFGAYPKLYAGIHERKLYRESYACLVGRSYPIENSTMSKSEFSNAQHIVVSAKSLGHIHGYIENEIVQACGAQNVRVETQNFLVGALIAAHTNTVVTVPSGVADALDYRNRIKILEPPIELPSFYIKQYWHERLHRDDAHRWLRATLSRIFEGSSGSGSTA